MVVKLSLTWWAVALRGALAIVFGVLTFLWPGLFWLAVVAIFGVYAILDGGLALSAALTGSGPRMRWLLALEGLAGLAAGVVALFWPDITQLAMFYLIATWALVTGALMIAAAVQLRRHIRGEWLLALGGALSVLLGVALALMPEAGLVAVAWWVGAYAVASGVVLLVLAFRLRSLARRGVNVEGVVVT